MTQPHQVHGPPWAQHVASGHAAQCGETPPVGVTARAPTLRDFTTATTHVGAIAGIFA